MFTPSGASSSSSLSTSTNSTTTLSSSSSSQLTGSTLIPRFSCSPSTHTTRSIGSLIPAAAAAAVEHQPQFHFCSSSCNQISASFVCSTESGPSPVNPSCSVDGHQWGATSSIAVSAPTTVATSRRVNHCSSEVDTGSRSSSSSNCSGSCTASTSNNNNNTSSSFHANQHSTATTLNPNSSNFAIHMQQKHKTRTSTESTAVASLSSATSSSSYSVSSSAATLLASSSTTTPALSTNSVVAAWTGAVLQPGSANRNQNIEPAPTNNNSNAPSSRTTIANGRKLGNCDSDSSPPPPPPPTRLGRSSAIPSSSGLPIVSTINSPMSHHHESVMFNNSNNNHSKIAQLTQPQPQPRTRTKSLPNNRLLLSLSISNASLAIPPSPSKVSSSSSSSAKPVSAISTNSIPTIIMSSSGSTSNVTTTATSAAQHQPLQFSSRRQISNSNSSIPSLITPNSACRFSSDKLKLITKSQSLKFDSNLTVAQPPPPLPIYHQSPLSFRRSSQHQLEKSSKSSGTGTGGHASRKSLSTCGRMDSATQLQVSKSLEAGVNQNQPNELLQEVLDNNRTSSFFSATSAANSSPKNGKMFMPIKKQSPPDNGPTSSDSNGRKIMKYMTAVRDNDSVSTHARLNGQQQQQDYNAQTNLNYRNDNDCNEYDDEGVDSDEYHRKPPKAAKSDCEFEFYNGAAGGATAAVPNNELNGGDDEQDEEQQRNNGLMSSTNRNVYSATAISTKMMMTPDDNCYDRTPSFEDDLGEDDLQLTNTNATLSRSSTASLGLLSNLNDMTLITSPNMTADGQTGAPSVNANSLQTNSTAQENTSGNLSQNPTVDIEAEAEGIEEEDCYNPLYDGVAGGSTVGALRLAAIEESLSPLPSLDSMADLAMVDLMMNDDDVTMESVEECGLAVDDLLGAGPNDDEDEEESSINDTTVLMKKSYIVLGKIPVSMGEDQQPPQQQAQAPIGLDSIEMVDSDCAVDENQNSNDLVVDSPVDASGSDDCALINHDHVKVNCTTHTAANPPPSTVQVPESIDTSIPIDSNSNKSAKLQSTSSSSNKENKPTKSSLPAKSNATVAATPSSIAISSRRPLVPGKLNNNNLHKPTAPAQTTKARSKNVGPKEPTNNKLTGRPSSASAASATTSKAQQQRRQTTTSSRLNSNQPSTTATNSRCSTPTPSESESICSTISTTSVSTAASQSISHKQRASNIRSYIKGAKGATSTTAAAASVSSSSATSGSVARRPLSQRPTTLTSKQRDFSVSSTRPSSAKFATATGGSTTPTPTDSITSLRKSSIDSNCSTASSQFIRRSTTYTRSLDKQTAAATAANSLLKQPKQCSELATKSAKNTRINNNTTTNNNNKLSTSASAARTAKLKTTTSAVSASDNAKKTTSSSVSSSSSYSKPTTSSYLKKNSAVLSSKQSSQAQSGSTKPSGGSRRPSSVASTCSSTSHSTVSVALRKGSATAGSSTATATTGCKLSAKHRSPTITLLSSAATVSSSTPGTGGPGSALNSPTSVSHPRSGQSSRRSSVASAANRPSTVSSANESNERLQFQQLKKYEALCLQQAERIRYSETEWRSSWLRSQAFLTMYSFLVNEYSPFDTPKLRTELATLHEKCCTLHRDYELAKEVIHQKESEADSLNEVLNQCTETNQELGQQIESLLNELDDCRREFTICSDERKLLETTLEEAKKEVAAEKTARMAAESHLEQLESSFRSDKKYRDLKEKVSLLEKEVDSLNVVIDMKTQRVRTLESEKMRNEIELSNYEQVKESYQRLKHEREALTETLAMKARKNAEQSRDIDLLKTELKREVNERKRMSVRYDQLEYQFNESREMLAEMSLSSSMIRGLNNEDEMDQDSILLQSRFNSFTPMSSLPPHHNNNPGGRSQSGRNHVRRLFSTPSMSTTTSTPASNTNTTVNNQQQQQQSQSQQQMLDSKFQQSRQHFQHQDPCLTSSMLLNDTSKRRLPELILSSIGGDWPQSYLNDKAASGASMDDEPHHHPSHFQSNGHQSAPVQSSHHHQNHHQRQLSASLSKGHNPNNFDHQFEVPSDHQHHHHHHHHNSHQRQHHQRHERAASSPISSPSSPLPPPVMISNGPVSSSAHKKSHHQTPPPPSPSQTAQSPPIEPASTTADS